MMFNKREKKFRTAARMIFESSEGKLVLKYLKEDFVDTSCYNDNPHTAYYQMGQQDVVKLLINLLSDEDREELENLQVSDLENY